MVRLVTIFLLLGALFALPWNQAMASTLLAPGTISAVVDDAEKREAFSLSQASQFDDDGTDSMAEDDESEPRREALFDASFAMPVAYGGASLLSSQGMLVPSSVHLDTETPPPRG